jgi:hypothetical protein
VVKYLSRLWDWLRYRRRYRVIEFVSAADEIPDAIPALGAVVAGSRERPTWIAFDCPCRGGHRIMLNLDPRRHPRWTLKAARPMSLYPSVDAFVGNRRCHYTITNGKVRWVPKWIATERGGAS